MSHHVYTTRGIVLSLQSVKEGDKVATVLTEDLGLVRAMARGMRKPGSKLSTSLLDLSLVRISLVRGQRQWRVTTVTLIRDVYSELRGQKQSREALYRVIKLIGKLVH